MFEIFLKNKKVLFLVIFLIVILLVLVVLRLVQTPKDFSPIAEPTSSINLKSPIEIISIDPLEAELLIPERRQKFKVIVEPLESVNNIKVLVLRRRVQFEDQFKEVKVNVLKDPVSGTINLSPEEDITPISEYSIFLSRVDNNANIKTLHYSSDKAPLIKIVNDLRLKQFLPYETNSFKLTFSEQRNIYIFSFKADPKSVQSIEVQYEKAKNEALKFIQEKGLDINLITIEWRYS